MVTVVASAPFERGAKSLVNFYQACHHLFASEGPSAEVTAELMKALFYD